MTMEFFNSKERAEYIVIVIPLAAMLLILSGEGAPLSEVNKMVVTHIVKTIMRKRRKLWNINKIANMTNILRKMMKIIEMIIKS